MVLFIPNEVFFHAVMIGCVGITLSDLTCALEQFLRMQSLNLENCHLNSKQLLNLNHFNPFLQFIEDEGTEFKGFALKGEVR